MDPLGPPLGADLSAGDAPDFLRIRLEERLIQFAAEAVDEELLHMRKLLKTPLNDMDLSAIKLQFRLKENNYEGNISMQVDWIDVYDATPGRSVRKLKKKELDELDAKYSNILKATSGGATPTKAPAKPQAPPKAPAKTANPAPTEAIADEPKAPKRGAKPTPALPEGKSTKKKAWGAAVDLKAKGLTDEELATAWVEIVEKTVGKETPDSKITPEQWYLIQEAVLEKTAMF